MELQITLNFINRSSIIKIMTVATCNIRSHTHTQGWGVGGGQNGSYTTCSNYGLSVCGEVRKGKGQNGLTQPAAIIDYRSAVRSGRVRGRVV